MSEISFEEMLEGQEINTVSNGDIIEGTVVEVKPDMIIMNIRCKWEGIIEKSEYTGDPSADLTTLVNVGDKITAKVFRVNEQEGYVLMTYKKLAQEKVYVKLEEAMQNREVLTSKVSQVRMGGLVVLVDGVSVFIPASLVSDRFEKDLTKYEGKEIRFIISECNPRRRRIIGDRKTVVLEEKSKVEEEVLSSISEGQKIKGVVKNLTKFGAFVDIGGLDALLHISEMGWGRITSPKQVVNPGEEIEVYVKEINGNKIALTLKTDDNNPWLNISGKYPVGTEVTGRVARLTDFGAFVEIEQGVDALLHVSQISNEHVAKPADVLNVGDEIEALIIDIDEEAKKISLSIKELDFRRKRYGE